METVNKSWFLKPLPIIGAVISIVGGTIGIWKSCAPVAEPPQVSGYWILTHIVEDSKPKNYIGQSYTFGVSVKQNGETLEGTGEQKKENNKLAEQHFKFDFTGKIDTDGNIELNYTLHGKPRDTEGFIQLKADGDKPERLVGTFRGGVAGMKGKADVKVER